MVRPTNSLSGVWSGAINRTNGNIQTDGRPKNSRGRWEMRVGQRERSAEHSVSSCRKHQNAVKSDERNKKPKKSVRNSRRRSKIHPKSSPRDQLNTKKSLERSPAHKKTNFGRPGPPSRTPKGPQIRTPNSLKSTQDLWFIPYVKKH